MGGCQGRIEFSIFEKKVFGISQCLRNTDTGRDLETDRGRATGLGPGKNHVTDDQGMTEIKTEGDATFTARIPVSSKNAKSNELG